MLRDGKQISVEIAATEDVKTQPVRFELHPFEKETLLALRSQCVSFYPELKDLNSELIYSSENLNQDQRGSALASYLQLIGTMKEDVKKKKIEAGQVPLKGTELDNTLTDFNYELNDFESIPLTADEIVAYRHVRDTFEREYLESLQISSKDTLIKNNGSKGLTPGLIDEIEISDDVVNILTESDRSQDDDVSVYDLIEKITARTKALNEQSPEIHILNRILDGIILAEKYNLDFDLKQLDLVKFLKEHRDLRKKDLSQCNIAFVSTLTDYLSQELSDQSAINYTITRQPAPEHPTPLPDLIAEFSGLVKPIKLIPQAVVKTDKKPLKRIFYESEKNAKFIPDQTKNEIAKYLSLLFSSQLNIVGVESLESVSDNEDVLKLLNGEWYESGTVNLGDFEVEIADSPDNLMGKACLIKKFVSADGNIQIIINIPNQDYSRSPNDFVVRITNIKALDLPPSTDIPDSVELRRKTPFNLTGFSSFSDQKTQFIVSYRSKTNDSKPLKKIDFVLDLSNGNINHWETIPNLEENLTYARRLLASIKSQKGYMQAIATMTQAHPDLNRFLENLSKASKYDLYLFVQAVTYRLLAESQL